MLSFYIDNGEFKGRAQWEIASGAKFWISYKSARAWVANKYLPEPMKDFYFFYTRRYNINHFTI